MSGGGALGHYMVGALTGLLPDRPYDLYAGTSAGALIAAFLAQYPTGQEAQALADLKTLSHGIQRDQVFSFKLPLPWSRALLDSSTLQAFIRREISAQRIHTSGKQLRVAAVNAYSGEPMYFRETDVAILDGVLASTAIPVLFEPVTIDGNLYIDGGIRMNTPISAAIAAGATEVDVITLVPKNPPVPAVMTWWMLLVQSVCDRLTRVRGRLCRRLRA